MGTISNNGAYEGKRASRGEERADPFADPAAREGYDEYRLREALKNLRDDRKESDNGNRA